MAAKVKRRAGQVMLALLAALLIYSGITDAIAHFNPHLACVITPHDC